MAWRQAVVVGGALGADVEGHPVRPQAEAAGQEQQGPRLLGLGPELARQGEQAGRVVDPEPDVDGRPGSVLGQLVQLALGVEGVAPQPGRERLGDVGGRLHCIAVQQPLRVDAELLEHLQLGAGGDLEAGAELVEGGQQLGLGVALHGVEALHPGQGRGQVGVALAGGLQVAARNGVGWSMRFSTGGARPRGQ
jgi:hypothetical protein